MLKLLPIASCSLTDVTLEFMISLPISDDYNAMLIVVDNWTKKNIIYHILWIKTALLWKLLLSCHFKIIRNFMVFYYYLLQIEISSLFQKFRKNICKILSISAHLFIFFHLKTEWQSEIANQDIKRYLHIFVNY